MREKHNTIDELRARITRLECRDHNVLGEWTVGQMYFHLAAAFEGSIEGLPAGYSLLTRIVLRPFRSFVTRVRFPPLLPIPRAIASKLLIACCFDANRLCPIHWGYLL